MRNLMRVCTLVVLMSCTATSRTDEPSVDGSSGGRAPETESACSLRGIASLVGAFSGLFGAGDPEAVSAILASDEDFLWFSDANVRPRVSIDDRDDAADLIALDGTPEYQVLQIHLSQRADGDTADVVFLLRESRDRVLLGKSLVRCTPPRIMSWTIGSSGPAAGPKPCEGDTEARRIGTFLVCLTR
jgi:hypothetical protein